MQSWVQDIGEIIRNKPFVIFTLILVGYYYLYMQMFLTIPKFAESLTGDSTGVAYVYLTISLSVIIFQMPVAKWLEKFPNRLTLIGIGSLFMGTGLFLFSFSTNLPYLLLNSLIFALGTMISGPLLMDAVPDFAPKRQLASYYGFNGFSLAIGGALSTIVGGWFYDLGIAVQVPDLPWFICMLVGLFVAFSFHTLQVKTRQHQQGINT
jgi:DHA1 family multidrug resistance protein-like MFS transporter